MFYRAPQYQSVPTHTEIVFKAWDLYESQYTSSAYIVAKQENGQLGYVSEGIFASTGSNVFNGTQTINGDLFVNGDINVSSLISASILYESGSTLFGNSSDDIHTFTGSIYLTGSIYFATGSRETNLAVGELAWDDTDGTLELGLKGSQVKLQIGQENVARVVNKTGQNLTEAGYKAVKIISAQGQRLAVDQAIANQEGGSADTLGLVTEDIAVNQEGFVTTYGLVNNINTTGQLQGENWTDGDPLYLSPFTSGSITNIKPQAPNHTVVIGFVVYSHQNNGKIFVKVDNGYEIDELHNVKIENAITGDILYKSGSVWTNTSLVHVNVNTVSTLILNQVSQSLNFANDAAAQAGGVPAGGLYHTNGVIKIRLV